MTFREERDALRAKIVDAVEEAVKNGKTLKHNILWSVDEGDHDERTTLTGLFTDRGNVFAHCFPNQTGENYVESWIALSRDIDLDTLVLVHEALEAVG